MHRMKQVGLYEAKTQLSSLVDQAAAGEEIVIAKNGKPKAKLMPLGDTSRSKAPRKLGQWATPASKRIDWDKWWRDWKAMDKEIEADFEASIVKPFLGKSESGEALSRAAALKGGRGAAPADVKRSKQRERSGKRKGARRP